MKSSTFVVVILSSFLIATTNAQTNFYVSKTGNDGNSGTDMNSAWLTVQHAMNNAVELILVQMNT